MVTWACGEAGYDGDARARGSLCLTELWKQEGGEKGGSQYFATKDMPSVP